MAMNPMLETDPDKLRMQAEVHARAIDRIKAERAENTRIRAEAATLGPLYYETKRAVHDVADSREAALIREQQRHERMREQLLTGAAHFEQMNADNRNQLRNV